MKEKITLFIALSFLVGLTAYKKSTANVEFANSSDLVADENIVQEDNNNESDLKNKVVLSNSNCESNQLDTDELDFSEAFKYYRNCNHEIFTWQGVEYTTTLKTDINENLEKNNKLLNEKLDLVVK